MKIRFIAASAAALAVTLVGCGADESKDQAAVLDEARQKVEQTLNDGSRDLEDAVNDMKGVVEQVFSEDVQPSDHQALKSLLPQKLGKLERVATSAEQRGVVGLTVSMANGEYETPDGNGRLAVSITDIGRMGSFASLGLSMTDVQIDREDRNGFERTTEFKGYRAIEKMSRMGEGSLAEMTVFVEDRIVLQIDAENVEWDTVRQAAESIDLAALAKML